MISNGDEILMTQESNIPLYSNTGDMDLAEGRIIEEMRTAHTVSYTHLTLPTSDLV